MKKQILMLILTLLPMVASAHDIEAVNAQGKTIYYVWTNNKTELAVSCQGEYYDSYSNEYSGEVVIPESVEYNGGTYSVTSIGFRAFYGCSGLTSATIGSGVTSIEDDAFQYCSSLTSVTIPNSVTSIGNYAFNGCSGLTSITIPNSVTSIGSGAFSNTGWYKNQPDGLLYLDNCLLEYKGVSPSGEVSIQEGTRLIAGYAFSGCSGLTSVTIPNSVTSIGSSAFLSCI